MVPFNSHNEAISLIMDSLSSCISRMSSELYSDPILDTLAHIKLHESSDVSKNYSVILGTVQALHTKARQKLVSWSQSNTSFAAVADAMRTGAGCVSRMQEVDTNVVNTFSSVGLNLDDFVQRYITECKVSDTMSRAEMLANIQNVKSSIYRHKVDFTDRTKLYSSTTNTLFACVLPPAEIVFEYLAYILTAITTVLQGDSMPAVYESYTADTQTTDKTSVFATATSSNTEVLLDFIKAHDSDINSMNQQAFAKFMQNIKVSYDQLIHTNLADEFK